MLPYAQHDYQVRIDVGKQSIGLLDIRSARDVTAEVLERGLTNACTRHTVRDYDPQDRLRLSPISNRRTHNLPILQPCETTDRSNCSCATSEYPQSMVRGW